MRRLALLLGLCAVLFAAGCGGDDAEPSGAEAVTVSGGTKAVIEVEKVPPPKKLVVRDIKVGTGDEAKPGDRLTVRYVGVRWNGDEFQSSWSTGKFDPFTFRLHDSLRQVIPGWEKGIPGMKVGGRRELIVPPDLVYWPNTFPDSDAQPKETLVYVVDLLKVKPQPQLPVTSEPQ